MNFALGLCVKCDSFSKYFQNVEVLMTTRDAFRSTYSMLFNYIYLAEKENQKLKLINWSAELIENLTF